MNDWGWKFTVTVEIDEVDLGTMSLHEMTSSYNYALSSLKEGYGAQSYPTQEEITRYDFAGAAAGETVEGGNRRRGCESLRARGGTSARSLPSQPVGSAYYCVSPHSATAC